MASTKKMAPVAKSEAITVKINADVEEIKPVKKTVRKAVSKSLEKTAKTTTKKKAEPEMVIPTVALKINEERKGINLFFKDKKYKTDEDSAFMKGEMHMRWQNTDGYWYVHLRDKAQVDKVISHFGDRLSVPEDLDMQVKAVLNEMKKGEKKTKKITAAALEGMTKKELIALFTSGSVPF